MGKQSDHRFLLSLLDKKEFSVFIHFAQIICSTYTSFELDHFYRLPKELSASIAVEIETMTTALPPSFNSNTKKRALVIGNDHYRQGKTLRNCADNAHRIEEKLSAIHFHVTLGIDLNCEQFDTILEEFTQSINPGDLILIFFSGYGTHWNDHNYLLPINDQHVNALNMFHNQAIRIDEMMAMIQEREPSAILYMFDACRSYPLLYVAATNGQNDFGGLYSIDAPPGSFVVCSCEPEKIISDKINTGEQNIFLKHLLEHIDKPNVSVNDMMNIIWEDMRNETNNVQSPFRSNGFEKNVYLNYQVDHGNKHELSARVQSIIAAAEPRTKIDLNNEQLVDRHMDNIVQQAIVNKECARLWLSGNKLTWVAAEILAPALINNRTLERLYLFGNRLSDKGVKLLANALGNNNHTLRILNLQDNGITDAGVEYLADMLKTNMTLISLWLGKNEITDVGVHVLANVLQNPKNKLEHLDLSGNRKITDASVMPLQDMLKHNHTLNELAIFDCNLSRFGKEKLRKCVKTKKNFSLCVNNWNE